MKELSQQDLTDLAEGAAIFSSGGGGDPLVGLNIVERLIEKRCPVRLIEPFEIPDDEIAVVFACVGATANAAYHSDSALKTLRALEEFLGRQVYAVVPAALSGFGALAAVDVASRHGVPVVDADGAGRAVPALHLAVYALDNVALTPIAVADVDAQKVVLIKRLSDSRSAERKARVLAMRWNEMAYAALGTLTGRQVKTSLVLNTLSSSMRIGMLLRKAVDPLRAVLRETKGSQIFEGVVGSVERETKKGFTWTTIEMDGAFDSAGSKLQLKAKNEFLVGYRDGKLAAIAPDVITTVSSDTCKCMPAEKIMEGAKLVVLGIPAYQKWRSSNGLELWREVLHQSGINDGYVPLEQLVA